MDFVVGGLAGVGAGFFTNPLDVVKTRMQLQGELKAKGKHTVHYKNIPHAIYTIVKYDGIGALQRGLVPALCFQWVVNGVSFTTAMITRRLALFMACPSYFRRDLLVTDSCVPAWPLCIAAETSRLGIYQQSDNLGLIRDEKGQTKFLNSVVIGCLSGVVASLFANPLQLVKTQLMSYSSKRIAVGTQHAHRGMTDALLHIYRKYGLPGLWRGSHGMVIRLCIGSASQLAAFAISKEWMEANKMFQQHKYLNAFVASNIGAVAKIIFHTPIDVITTRLYNQALDSKGHGRLYSGVIDCVRKIIKAEGPFGLYKGLAPAYLRQAPYSVLLLVFWDMLKDVQKKFENSVVREKR